MKAESTKEGRAQTNGVVHGIDTGEVSFVESTRAVAAGDRGVALVDTGAIMLCVPEHVAVQLNLQEIEKREVTTADERRVVVPYVGPVQVHFENRTCFTGALVLGETVLVGAVPREDMDLVVNPARQTVTVNPESPNIPPLS